MLNKRVGLLMANHYTQPAEDLNQAKDNRAKDEIIHKEDEYILIKLKIKTQLSPEIRSSKRLYIKFTLPIAMNFAAMLSCSKGILKRSITTARMMKIKACVPKTLRIQGIIHQTDDEDHGQGNLPIPLPYHV